MDDAHAVSAAPTDPAPTNPADLPAVVKSNLRYVDELTWFEPSDLRFIEEITRGTRDSIYVFEYVPTRRHLFLDSRGRTYQFAPGTDPSKLASGFRLHNPHPCGVADLRPERPNPWRDRHPYGRDPYPDPYRRDPWVAFDAAPPLSLVDDDFLNDGCSTRCYGDGMRREITQRELRNQSGEIMRALDAGDEFVVTRNGVPVGELLPLRRKHFVPAEAVIEAFRGAPPIDFKRFRADIDEFVDQDPTPRG